MRASFLTVLVLAACATPTGPADGPAHRDDAGPELAPPPASLSIETPSAYTGAADIVVTGDLAIGERVQLVVGTDGVGVGPCFPFLGGACLDVVDPGLAGAATVDEAGTVTIPIELAGAGSHALQAVVIRGLGGADSVISDAALIDVTDPVYGCTDPAAPEYDPSATHDDGTCSDALYAGIAGGWSGEIRETYDSSGAERATYPVVLDIPEHLDVGEEAVVADYTSYGCTGSWTRVEEAGDTYAFTENSYDGCLSGIPVRVSWDRISDTMVYRFDDYGGFSGIGILHRD